LAFRDRWPAGTLLHALGEDNRQSLLGLGTRRAFPPGATLIQEGSAEADTFVLLDGYGKVLGNTPDGRAVLLSVRGPGDLVGELAALDHKPRSASVVALTKVTARVVARGCFLAYLRDHPAATRLLQAAILDEFRRATQYRISTSGAPTGVRLALVLTYLMESFGRQHVDGIRIEVPLSQPELASLIGVSEPSLQRALAELRRQGIIETRYRRLVVRDPGALSSMT
jgi:CRP/FNR family cyclic AMP-dependent transcriptional regulator